MSESRESKIRARLEARFTPVELQIRDQSHMHAGHAGAADGRGHFAVTIVSSEFAGTNRVQRHQMVYDALRALLESDIHALRIKALTPDER
ncbi:MAG: BolA family transcriptional regulator [Gammaproteobacteria bacterium]|nr:BolA family transcriptional regulator [Gammaproteobacteria bacterium]